MNSVTIKEINRLIESKEITHEELAKSLFKKSIKEEENLYGNTERIKCYYVDNLACSMLIENHKFIWDTLPYLEKLFKEYGFPVCRQVSGVWEFTKF